MPLGGKYDAHVTVAAGVGRAVYAGGMAGEFGPDGTQALPPLPVYPDTLSGLGGQSYQDVPDTVVPLPPTPPTVDHERVRAAARRELARDRTRQAAPPVQPTPLPPAVGLPRVQTTVGLPGARSLPPVPDAIQTQRKNAASGCIGCAVVLVLVFVAFVAVVIVAGTRQ